MIAHPIRALVGQRRSMLVAYTLPIEPYHCTIQGCRDTILESLTTAVFSIWRNCMIETQGLRKWYKQESKSVATY